MNRRFFLRGLMGGAAALALDPEKLLFVPGKKLISIPRSSLTPQQIADCRKVIDALVDHLYAKEWDRMMAEAVQVGCGWVQLIPEDLQFYSRGAMARRGCSGAAGPVYQSCGSCPAWTEVRV
jgi:hypothetical protein